MNQVSITLILDLVGSCLSLLTVYLATKLHRYTWSCALAAIFVNAYLYLDQQVWGHFFLDLFYAIAAIFGWHHWKRTPKPKKLSNKGVLIVLISLFIGTTFCSTTLISLQGHAIAFDAFGTSCAIMAQILTCFAYCESWPLWLTHDLMNLAIDIDRSLWFHAGKEIIYLFLAYSGWKNWENLRKKANAKVINT